MSCDAVPQNLFKTISCRCSTGRMGVCGSRKAGLNCSSLCKFCMGQDCNNRNEVILEDNDGNDLETLLFERK